MKVLLINKYHFPKAGAETCYFNTAKILEKNGHELAYFSMNHPKNYQTEWSKYFIKNVDYNKKQNFFEKIKSSFNILYNFRARKNLRKLIKDFKPDVAHLHNIYHQLSPSVIAELKKQNVPMVFTLHDYKLICPNYSLFANGKIWEKSKKTKYYRCFFSKCIKNSYLKSLVATLEAYLHKILKTYQKVDLYISPSIFLKKKFRSFGFKKEIEVLPYPLLGFPESSQKIGDYILFFGRLSQEKGVDDLIKAYAKLETDTKLVITGEGPEEKNLKTLVKQLGLVNKVVFKGYKSGHELKNIVHNSKIVVYPSRWYENAPFSVSEAMAMSKVVVATKIGGLNEMIEDKKTGFLYHSGNINELSRIIENLLSDNERLAEIGKNAYNFVKDHNDPDKYYQELINIYKKVIER